MSRTSSRVVHRLPYMSLLAVVLVACAVVAAADAERASLWRDRQVVVDGSDAEWEGLTLPVKGEHFSLGLVNDGQSLYLCLPTKDLSTRTQIAREGLAIWIDKAGGKKNNFGIHFPIGLRPGGAGFPRPPERDRKPSEEPKEEKPIGGQDEIAILGPGLREAQVVLLNQAGGIEARVAIHDDLLVYELKVPLRRDELSPFAPELKPGDMVRLTLETPSLPTARAPLAPGPGGVIITRGPGGWGGGVRVGGAVMPGNMRKPVDVTMNVRLASSPSK